MKAIIFISTIFILTVFSDLPEKMEKKINKEVLNVFEIDDFNKDLVSIDPESLAKMSASFNTDGFFKIVRQDKMLGYFYYGQGQAKATVYDFVVIFDKEMIVRKIKVLAYREDYGGEISSKRWLRQFEGIGTSDQMRYSKDIKAISGATISAESMTRAVNELLHNLSFLPSES